MACNYTNIKNIKTKIIENNKILKCQKNKKN